jgi:two-component system cell cycle response regulator
MSEQSARVLVVHSEAQERLLQRELFANAGMTVLEAGSGAAALEIIAHDRPVLVASSRNLTADKIRGLQLGADDYLSVPCDPAELLARAKALLRTKLVHDKIRKLQVSLEQMVVSDPLTGLSNRRYLMDRLTQEMQRSDRHGEPLAFAMVDLDGFKPINDQFGHVIGDKVLRAVGSAISRSVRVSDVAARYGGDEFAIILPQTPAEGAMRVCERILRSISELQLQDEHGTPCKVTASLGLAYYPAEDVETPEDLVHSADGALYGAKRSGKNRFTAVRIVQPLASA